MKQIQVRKVPYGETFSVFGDKFVALDYINGKVLAIRKEIWKNAPFDTSGRPALPATWSSILRTFARTGPARTPSP